jgi:UDP-GlcNAc:undecaprenyl-phosphate GlcNAc-1-phosphate transferase
MVLGLTMAAAAIIVTGQVDPEIVSQRESIPAIVPIVLPIMVVAVPLADMVLAVIRRTIRGESPWAADAHHLHHQLLRFGHSHRWAVAVLYIWTAVLSFGTVSLVFMGVRHAAILLGSGIVAAALITFSPKFRDALSLALRSSWGRAVDALRSAASRARGRRSSRRGGVVTGEDPTAVVQGGKK